MNSSFITSKPDPEVIKTFACSTQLTMKFHTGYTTKMLKIKTFLAFKLSIIVFIMLLVLNTNCLHCNIYEQKKIHAQLF